jgi:hypothetical protein
MLENDRRTKSFNSSTESGAVGRGGSLQVGGWEYKVGRFAMFPSPQLDTERQNIYKKKDPAVLLIFQTG